MARASRLGRRHERLLDVGKAHRERNTDKEGSMDPDEGVSKSTRAVSVQPI